MSVLEIPRGSDDPYSVPGTSSRARGEPHNTPAVSSRWTWSVLEILRGSDDPYSIPGVSLRQTLFVLRHLRLRVATFSVFVGGHGAKHRKCFVPSAFASGDPLGVCGGSWRYTVYVLRRLHLQARCLRGRGATRSKGLAPSAFASGDRLSVCAEVIVVPTTICFATFGYASDDLNASK